MGQIGHCRSTLGKLSTTQKVVELPGSTDTPAKIDISGNIVVAVSMWFDEEIHWTVAETDAIGATRISSNDTRCRTFADGYMQLPVVGNAGAIYVRRVSGSAVAAGLAYTLIEGD
jgi:hypothetical protein